MTNASNLPTPARGAVRPAQAVAVVEGAQRGIRELSSSAHLAAARLCAMPDERRRSAVLALAVQEFLRVVGLTLRPGGCIYRINTRKISNACAKRGDGNR
jgi:hypothetical protein